jgi:hypothetical protein
LLLLKDFKFTKTTAYSYKLLIILRVHFSQPLPVDLTMIMLCEYTGTLEIHKNTTTSTR